MCDTFGPIEINGQTSGSPFLLEFFKGCNDSFESKLPSYFNLFYDCMVGRERVYIAYLVHFLVVYTP